MKKIEQERKRLLREGKTLFSMIGDDLNEFNDNTERPPGNYRRQIDHEEICIALALLAELTGMDVEGDH